MIKKIFSTTTTLLLISVAFFSLLFGNIVYANNFLATTQPVALKQMNVEQITIEEFDNGDYFETIITSNEPLSFEISTMATSHTITKTKTTNYKNASGTILWSVSIKATFTYDGKTSKCISCSHSTTAPSKAWSIKSCTSSKSGNKATAKAVAVHTEGSYSSTITKSVTISCSPNGTVS